MATERERVVATVTWTSGLVAGACSVAVALRLGWALLTMTAGRDPYRDVLSRGIWLYVILAWWGVSVAIGVLRARRAFGERSNLALAAIPLLPAIALFVDCGASWQLGEHASSNMAPIAAAVIWIVGLVAVPVACVLGLLLVSLADAVTRALVAGEPPTPVLRRRAAVALLIASVAHLVLAPMNVPSLAGVLAACVAAYLAFGAGAPLAVVAGVVLAVAGLGAQLFGAVHAQEQIARRALPDCVHDGDSSVFTSRSRATDPSAFVHSALGVRGVGRVAVLFDAAIPGVPPHDGVENVVVLPAPDAPPPAVLEREIRRALDATECRSVLSRDMLSRPPYRVFISTPSRVDVAAALTIGPNDDADAARARLERSIRAAADPGSPGDPSDPFPGYVVEDDRVRLFLPGGSDDVGWHASYRYTPQDGSTTDLLHFPALGALTITVVRRAAGATDGGPVDGS